jgi:hypothetical protein
VCGADQLCDDEIILELHVRYIINM